MNRNLSDSREHARPKPSRIGLALCGLARLAEGPVAAFAVILLFTGGNAVGWGLGLLLADTAVATAAHSYRRKWRTLRGEKRRRLGVVIDPPRVPRGLRREVAMPERDGLLVRAVLRGSPAARAGVERGDLILAAGTRETNRVDALYEVLDEWQPEEDLVLKIVRGADEHTIAVSL